MQAGFDFCSIEIYIFDRFNTGGTKLCTIGLLQMFVACWDTTALLIDGLSENEISVCFFASPSIKHYKERF